jgi:hypothetical protein
MKDKEKANLILAKYRKGVDLDSHLKAAKLDESYKWLPGYYRILSNQEPPKVMGADYLFFQPGEPIGEIHEKEERVEKPVKKEAKEPAKKNGKKPPLKVRNPEGKVVEVA